MTVFSNSARFYGWKEVVGTIVIMERKQEEVMQVDGADDVDLSRGGSQQRLALQVAHLTSVGLLTITMRRRMTRTTTRTRTMMMIIPPEPPPRKAAVFPSTALHSEKPSMVHQPD